MNQHNAIVTRSDNRWRSALAWVVSAALLFYVFGYATDPRTNVVDVHLAHLRRKLAGMAIAISTIRGAGFRLEVASP